MQDRNKNIFFSIVLATALFGATPWLKAAEGSPPASLRVIAGLADGVGVGAVEARVVVEAASGGRTFKPLRVPGKVDLELPAGAATVRLEAPGYWSNPLPATPGEARLRLHPETRLAGTVATRARGALPAALQLRLEGPSLASSVILTCPVEQSGRYTCIGPAGVYDLQVRAHGFAPVFRWAVELAAQRETTLEALTLQAGASISGFVARTDGTVPSQQASVSLSLQVVRVSGDRKGTEVKPLAVLEHKTRPDQRGSFVFGDLSPGRYNLEASEPGWSSTRIEGLEVLEGSETQLRRPLELARPATLQVRLWPALTPAGERWRLRVVAESRRGDPAGSARLVDAQGFAEFEGLAEDQYLLVVEDPDNGRPFAQRDEVVSSPITFVEWDLPLIAVEGWVTLGRKPLTATVTFAPTGLASRRFESNEEGRFEGVLSRAGEWDVLIEARAQGVTRWLRDVRVPEPLQAGEAVRVDLKLPATEVSGTVVDEASRPLRAEVVAQAFGARDRAMGLVSDEHGDFSFRGLAPGPVDLYATTKDKGVSSVVRVELPPDASVGPILLRVERKRALHGLLAGRDGPVRGGRVVLRGVGSPLYAGSLAQATSDAQGAFSLEIPAQLAEAQLEVWAPGYALVLRRWPLGETDLQIQLEEVWGTAEIEWDPTLVDRLWVAKDGAASRFSKVVSWASAHPSEGEARPGFTRVPRLEPGQWFVCAPKPGSPEWTRLEAFGMPGPDCEKLEVIPWGVAKVSLRDNQQQRKGKP